jgi:2'-5' RNA ligase
LSAARGRNAEAERVWDTFRASQTTLGPTPGAAEAWRAGRDRYLVWALRVSAPAVLARAAEVAARLGEAVVAVPARDAHVTVWVCGFPAERRQRNDDVEEDVLREQCLRVAGTRVTRMTVGRPNAFATCAFLEVDDEHGELEALRARLHVAGAPEIRFSPYLPHVTVGRFVDSRPVAPLAAAIAELRQGTHAAPLAVTDATLTLFELDARAPERMKAVWPATPEPARAPVAFAEQGGPGRLRRVHTAGDMNGVPRCPRR